MLTTAWHQRECEELEEELLAWHLHSSPEQASPGGDVVPSDTGTHVERTVSEKEIWSAAALSLEDLVEWHDPSHNEKGISGIRGVC